MARNAWTRNLTFPVTTSVYYDSLKYYKLYAGRLSRSFSLDLHNRLANDGQPTNDYKNMNSHSYPLFKAGHIQSIYVALQGNKYMIRCLCLPEMKKDIIIVQVKLNNG